MTRIALAVAAARRNDRDEKSIESPERWRHRSTELTRARQACGSAIDAGRRIRASIVFRSITGHATVGQHRGSVTRGEEQHATAPAHARTVRGSDHERNTSLAVDDRYVIRWARSHEKRMRAAAPAVPTCRARRGSGSAMAPSVRRCPMSTAHSSSLAGRSRDPARTMLGEDHRRASRFEVASRRRGNRRFATQSSAHASSIPIGVAVDVACPPLQSLHRRHESDPQGAAKTRDCKSPRRRPPISPGDAARDSEWAILQLFAVSRVAGAAGPTVRPMLLRTTLVASLCVAGCVADPATDPNAGGEDPNATDPPAGSGSDPGGGGDPDAGGAP